MNKYLGIAALGILSSMPGVAQITNLGGGLAGQGGIPQFEASTLTGPTNQVWPHAKVSFELSAAAPNASATLILGFSMINLPILGGILVPSPDMQATLTTDTAGLAEISLDWPNTTTPVYAQYLVIDSSAPYGVTFSNSFRIIGEPIGAASETFLAELFGGASVSAGEDAYAEIITRGHAGIDALISFASAVAASSQFPGPSPGAFYSSLIPGYQPGSQGNWQQTQDSSMRRSLYAVDAILANDPVPHADTRIHSRTLGPTQSVAAVDQEVLASYGVWWAANQTLTLLQLRALPLPLSAATGFSPLWVNAGPQQDSSFWGLTSDEYVCLADTDTPFRKPDIGNPYGVGVTPSGFHYLLLSPLNAGGPTPQNCLGFALGIAGWPMDPNSMGAPPQGTGGPMDLDEVMTDEGYTEEADRQTGMMNQQPNEDVVVNISVEVTNENGSVSDMGWQHSMIRKWVATQFLWCSKNGSGDVYQFSDNHYNDHLLDIGIGGPGKTLSERTYRR